MKIKAYAKINLGLDVLHKREDGYHELHMVMLPIGLYDLIDIEPSIHAFFRCIPPYRILPEKNTLLKAIEVCREARPFKQQFKIHLHKNIPSQAGLGGGSSDAAAVINYLDDYFKWNLTQQEKIDLGLKVGADVPFCLFNRPAIVSGIGEKLKFFEVKDPMNLILVQPHKGVSTKLAFKDLQIETCDHPDILRIASALETGNTSVLYEHMGNALEKRAIELVPEIDLIKKQLLDLGCDHCMMTGSGSVVMGFSQDLEILKQAAEALKSQYRFVKITKVLD